VELNKDQLVFGRGADADIPLTDKRISRKHALLHHQNQEYSILDLDSRNGVYLNGMKVHSAVLRDEDVIRLGDEVFVYYEG
jgi:pSer/pThr/pTyr-binding forkhead associated (FHA) protein